MAEYRITLFPLGTVPQGITQPRCPTCMEAALHLQLLLLERILSAVCPVSHARIHPFVS